MTQTKTAHAGGTAKGGENNGRHANRSTKRQRGQVYHAANGKPCGHVIAGVLYKRQIGSVHMLRAPRGWALDRDPSERHRLGVHTVHITDTETGTVYVAPLAEFDMHGVPLDRGFGPQIVLPLGYWHVDGQPPALAKREPPGAGRQLALFGDAQP